ncbi:MAG TPA: enoyl-CoA hydratase-related protein, partial [Phycisphaerales bacterium]|nr:enoyl-CoA hydratase-related protein [Phycisphaerales bacterium]
MLAELTLSDGLARLTLNRPEARNALSLELLEGLHTRLDELDGRLVSARVLVVAGAGRAFCAGMDLKQVLGDHGAAPRLLRSLAELTLRLRALPMPVIAAVSGAAIGGGCGLACACDFAVTHADAKLGFPEVDLGVCPAVVAPWVVRRIGAGRARRLLLGGGLLSGRRAHELGIVTDLVETQAELQGRVAELVGRIMSGGPEALRATKRLLNELDGSLDAELVRRGAELSAA